MLVACLFHRAVGWLPKPALTLALAHRCSNLDYEVIVIDDASPDGTQEVVAKLQTAYGHDRIVRQFGQQPHAALLLFT